MVIWDDRILEYINAKGHGAPSQLVESGYVRVTRQHVTRRLNKLVEHGLLEPLGNGVHVMTERGKRYLDGELDTGEDRSDEPPEPPIDSDDDLS